MALEMEVAGEMLSTGLIAHEIDDAKGEAHGPKALTQECLNCKAPVRGNFCAACGQKGHIHHSVLHLGEELAHGILHFDTKGWRTLPLLAIRPGQLTRRYVDGQRTRFVSPLALFLFMMFLMFFVFSLTVSDSTKDMANEAKQAGTTIEQKIEERKADLAEAQKELAAAVPGSPDARAAQRAIDKANRKIAALSMVNSGGTSTQDGKVIAGVSSDFELEKATSSVPWVRETIKHAIENPELTKYKLKNAAYKYAFLLVPLTMPFLWLMLFWKKSASMYTHAVFSLYSLSFMSLLMVVIALLSYVGFGGVAAFLFCFVPPVHMYFQLRDTYFLKRWEALWRTAGLMFIATIALTLYAVAIVMLSR
jgi:hypothetical protein